MESKHTPFEQLTITNKFMFAMVFSHKEIAKPFLEAVLGIKIYELREPEPEKTIEVSPVSKGVRFDVFVKESGSNGETIRSFDIENADGGHQGNSQARTLLPGHARLRSPEPGRKIPRFEGTLHHLST